MRESRRKQIDKNVEVTIRNNTHGTFEVPGLEATITLEKYGDEEFVTFGELRRLRKYLVDMDILVVEVSSDEDTLYDVITALRLNKVYDEYFESVLNIPKNEFEEVDYIEHGALEDFVLDSDQSEFEKVLKGALRPQIIITSVVLYREKKLTDYAKMTIVKNTRPYEERGDFWNDVDLSN